MVCLLLSFTDTVAQPYGSISFETFYHELAPYGSWVHNSQYGQVWIPNVGRGFRPYQTQGHWIMTEYGNTWVSDYAWGWAPFHYGRWYLDDYYGWMWVPGSEWGPAWVAWRSGGGYYGWAPLSPGLNVNISINIGRRLPRSYWTFVPQRYITSAHVYNYCVPRGRVVNVINHTTVINNTYVYNNQHHYYSGPRGRDIERVTHRAVPVRRVQSARQPGATSVRGGSVAMYRPTVRSQQEGSTRGATTNIRQGGNATRSSAATRSSYDQQQRSGNPSVRSSAARTGEATRSMYDNRSGRASEPNSSNQSRTRTSQSQPSTTRRSSVSSPRTYSSPSATPSRTRSSYGSSSSSGSSRGRSVPSSATQRSRSNSGGSSAARSASPNRASGSPSMSRSRASTPSAGSSRSSASSSSSSRRSAASSGRSSSGGSRSGGSRARPQ